MPHKRYRPVGPFSREQGEWLCIFCGSNEDNPNYYCARCRTYKVLYADATEEPVDQEVVKAEKLIRSALTGTERGPGRDDERSK